MILLATFEGRKPAPPGMLDDGTDSAKLPLRTNRPTAAGYDLEADILPALAERTSQKRADPIRI